MHFDGISLPTQGPFAGGSRYNTYSSFLKERFGVRVRKVSVDGGFTCPNRDGTISHGGCIYCNNDSFRPPSALRASSIPEQVEKGIDFLTRRHGAGKYIVYFQPFSNTYAPLDVLAPLYLSALSHPDVIGLAVGTRPDCVDDAKIQWFEDLAQHYFVVMEYGLQSIYDGTLERINRGHTYRCWQEAMRRTRGRGIWIGTHLILGFPWESREEMLATAPAISSVGLDFLKIHHLHVVKNTVLAHEFDQEHFHLLEYQEYVELLVDFLERLDPRVRIERLFGHSPREILVGPQWNKNAAQIHHDIQLRLELRQTWQGRLYAGLGA